VKEPEPQPPKLVTASTGIPKTISIKEQTSVRQPQQQVSEPVSSLLLEASGLSEILSGNAAPPLQQLWNMFADQLNKQGKMALYSAMKKRQPQWSDEMAILFLVDNASLEKDFNQMKPDLMEHLRKAMSKPALSLNIEVAKDESGTDRPYSAADKYKRLAERNPKLNEMKKLFDLDVD
jgi:DNA polymerase-3 subunit gamma/tau